MVIWEKVDGELHPKMFCDICGWECQGDDYEEVDGLILCPNCIKQNHAEVISEGANE